LEYLEKVVKETKTKSPKDKFVITIYLDSSSSDPTKRPTPEEIKKLAELKDKLEEGGNVVNIISVLKPEEPKEVEEIKELAPVDPKGIIEHVDTAEELEEVVEELVE